MVYCGHCSFHFCSPAKFFTLRAVTTSCTLGTTGDLHPRPSSAPMLQRLLPSARSLTPVRLFVRPLPTHLAQRPVRATRAMADSTVTALAGDTITHLCVFWEQRTALYM